MKRSTSRKSFNQSKRNRREFESPKFQILGITQFIWLLDYRTFGALACTSKQATEYLPLSHDYNKIPKHRALRLARRFRKLYDREISQKDYDEFAKTVFTEQEFIDYNLPQLAPSDRQYHVRTIIETIRPRRNASLLKCFDLSENITKRLDSHKETNLPVSMFQMSYPPKNSLLMEFAFQGGSLLYLGKLIVFWSNPVWNCYNCPAFSTWTSLDDIDLKCFKELAKEGPLPPPWKWETGEAMIDMICNQPGFAVLCSVPSWYTDPKMFEYLVARCRIDYSEQDFANLELDVNCFLNSKYKLAREPPLWVWKRLFPNKQLADVPSHLQALIVPDGAVKRYFK